MLAKCNPCVSGPCLNHGVCHADLMEIYKCSCPPGFKVRAWLTTGPKAALEAGGIKQIYKKSNLRTRPQGKNCETALNACVSNPCANGGSCRVDEEEEGAYM